MITGSKITRRILAAPCAVVIGYGLAGCAASTPPPSSQLSLARNPAAIGAPAPQPAESSPSGGPRVAGDLSERSAPPQDTRSPTKLAAAASGEVIVAPGDTLSSIAGRHRVSISDLMSANNLRGIDVAPGQRLSLPKR